MASPIPTQMNTRRPAGITLIVILGYLNGIVTMLVGLFAILDRDDADLVRESHLSSDQLLWWGLVAIAFGVITVLLVSALGRGSEIVRILVAILAVMNAALGVYALVAFHGEQQLSGAFSLCFALLVLYLLFNHRADDWFEAQNQP